MSVLKKAKYIYLEFRLGDIIDGDNQELIINNKVISTVAEMEFRQDTRLLTSEKLFIRLLNLYRDKIPLLESLYNKKI